MALRLNGSGSGYVGIDAPVTAANNTLVLPNGNGSNGQALTTNGSGTLSWTSITSSQWTTSGSDIYYTTGKVGVGISSPSYTTHIKQGGQDALGLEVASNDSRLIIGNTGSVWRLSATYGSTGSYQPITFNTSDTERIRIQANGSTLFGTTTESIIATNNTTGVGIGVNEGGTAKVGSIVSSVDGDTCLYLNRKSADGILIRFYQDATLEGDISVSGTTVQLNGAHLSRWSQLPDGAEREAILRGTILSNLDEMCEWGDEENEQLNRMKVSDIEGDKNVAGVFVDWDDEDDAYTNDFYCAMTGDFIIRIGTGVTVERGDLLMSAGDGTAKPQDDDIIRSKTIAKVTSTNVSCTYDDGSYCVPCVLMAC